MQRLNNGKNTIRQKKTGGYQCVRGINMRDKSLSFCFSTALVAKNDKIM